MAGAQMLSLDDPLYSVMIGGKDVIITLANILEVAKLKNELDMAHQTASDLDVKLTSAVEKSSIYWTKLLEGQVIVENFNRLLTEEKEVTKRLTKALEQGTGNFVKDMGKEFLQIVRDLIGWLTKIRLGGAGTDGDAESGRKMELELFKDFSNVLKSLKDELEEGAISKGEEIIRNLGLMKGIIKTIRSNADIDLESPSKSASNSGKEGEQISQSSSGPEDGVIASSVVKPLSTEVDDDVEDFETHIEEVEDDDGPIPPPGGEELSTSGGTYVADKFGFQGGETISSGGVDDFYAELPVKKAKITPTTSNASKPQSHCSTTAAATTKDNKHDVHPDNSRMCICGFATNLTNLKQHIWRLTDGRGTTAGHHVCPKCGDRFKSRSGFKRHLALHTDGIPNETQVMASMSCTCITCLKIFPNRRALKNHRRKAHFSGSVATKVAPNPKAVPDEAIGKANQPQQKLHQIDMDKKNNGSSSTGHGCGNQCITPRAMITHIPTTSQQVQIKCHLCSQQFFSNFLMVQHLQMRHQIRPPSKVTQGESGHGFSISCSFCGGKFSDYDELYKHRQDVHGIGQTCT